MSLVNGNSKSANIPAIAQQAIALFEGFNLGPEVIAEQLNLDEVTVKTILLQYSKVYRKQNRTPADDEETEEQKKEKNIKFSSSELEYAHRAMVDLIDSEDEHIKFKASRFVIDEKRGRHDVDARRASELALQGATVNVLVIDNTMRKAREALKLAREGASKEKPVVILDVEMTTETNQSTK